MLTIVVKEPKTQTQRWRFQALAPSGSCGAAVAGEFSSVMAQDKRRHGRRLVAGRRGSDDVRCTGQARICGQDAPGRAQTLPSRSPALKNFCGLTGSPSMRVS